jgi:hypothetical protein
VTCHPWSLKITILGTKRVSRKMGTYHCVPSHRESAKHYRNGLNGRWQIYKGNARKRGIPFEISIADIAEFWQKPCEYCGGQIDTVGLDRIDSTKFYTKENIVTCCARCNEMKMADSVSMWAEKMKAILRHLGEL